jgi:PAS domain S-box-containing protein
MGIRAITPSSLAGAAAPVPASSSLLDMPSSHVLALLVALLVLAMAGMAIAGHRRRDREQRDHLRAMREREQRLRLSLWASNEIYWQYDLEKRELERTRVEPDRSDDLAVQVDLDKDHQIHEEDLPLVLERLREYVTGGTQMFLSEHRILGEGGQWQWMRARGRAIARDATGRVTRIAGTARNVTSIREKERERRIANEVMHNMAESVAVVDAEFRFVAVNPAFTRMSGYEASDVIGKDGSIINSDQQDEAFYEKSRKAMQQQGCWSGEMWQKRKDGRDFLCAVQFNAIVEPGTRKRLYVVVLSDITEQKRAEQELRYLANYDTLTNLPNRTLLSERLSRAIVRARRQGSRMWRCCSSTWTVSRTSTIRWATPPATASCARRRAPAGVVGDGHTVARLGGDEFTVVLEDLSSGDEAERCAQRIIDAFDAPLVLDDRHEIAISPSIGISLFPDHAPGADRTAQARRHRDVPGQGRRPPHLPALRRCDGRRHPPPCHPDRRCARSSSAANCAWSTNRAWSLADGRIGGVEALLRWNSPEHGDVPPEPVHPAGRGKRPDPGNRRMGAARGLQHVAPTGTATA